MLVLTKSEFLVDSTKKCISIQQNLFDLTKFSWISNKTVLPRNFVYVEFDQYISLLYKRRFPGTFKQSNVRYWYRYQKIVTVGLLQEKRYFQTL